MKVSIENALEMISEYNKKKEECDKLYKNCKEVLSDIDLDYVVNNLNYKESKELSNKLGYLIPSEVSDKLSKIIQGKKEQEYPELLDAHYFVELKELDLPQDLRVVLDKTLCGFKRYSVFSEQSLFKNIKVPDIKRVEIINFLKEKEIIEDIYWFNCRCGECGGEEISMEQRNKFYKYHNFDYNNATEEEIYKHEDSFFREGYFSIGCFNEMEREICDINDFEENLSKIKFKLRKKPDESLDLI